MADIPLIEKAIMVEDVPTLVTIDSTPDDSSEKVDGEEDPPLGRTGMKCATRSLYDTPKDPFDFSKEIDWQEEIPAKYADGQAADTRRAEYAVLLRFQFKNNKPVLHSLVVQSPLIKQAMATVLKDFPGINLETDLLEFHLPLQPLFHRWSELTAACDQPSDPETGSHLTLLRDALQPHFAPAFKAFAHYKTHGEIEFEHLWTLFPPESVVITQQGKCDSAFSVSKTEIFQSKRDGRTYLILHCFCVDYDGSRFGKSSEPIAIGEYPGKLTPVDFNAFPLDHHPQKDVIRTKLIARGKRFLELSTTSYVSYEGVAVDHTTVYASGLPNPTPHYVRGRVVVDAATYMRFNPNADKGLYPLNFVAVEKKGSDAACSDPMSGRAGYALPGSPFYYPDESERLQEYAIHERRKAHHANDAVLTDDQLLICKRTVRGYSLTIKRWLDFEIDYIKDIQWNSRAFSSLALPGDYKNFLLAFAKSQSNQTVQFDDVIEGKGKGLVVLLEGPPGVGKTLTVESVAEEMRVPLYSVAAGELGSTGHMVESKLEEVLQIAKAWNAIVLLDEADIFLQTRTPEELARNQVVGIFLRLLEYYEGTIFLTTNRADSIDPAFQSRIHLCLPYPELSDESRRKIWRTCISLANLDTSCFTDDVYDRWADEGLNGREIKNVVKMAVLLASAGGDRLLPAHVEEVLGIWRDRKRRGA